MSDVRALVHMSIENCVDIPKEKVRSFLKTIETEMRKHPQVEAPVTHRFSKGIYAREMFMPKGTLLIGKIHKFRNLNIISSGEVSFLSIDGVLRVKAPFSTVSSPGVQRLIYAHEDTTWTTIHATSETDLEKIEEEVIAKTYADVPENELELLKEASCLGV